MKKTVFLCGPMRGIQREIGLKWVERATKLLSSYFIVRHAYRGREIQETFADPKSAVARDKYDVLQSDVLIVNDTFPGASMIGTAMEVCLAFENHKPIIVFGKAHDKDYFLNYHSHARCDSLEDACELANRMFSN
jgi:hypothetical protein